MTASVHAGTQSGAETDELRSQLDNLRAEVNELRAQLHVQRARFGDEQGAWEREKEKVRRYPPPMLTPRITARHSPLPQHLNRLVLGNDVDSPAVSRAPLPSALV